MPLPATRSGCARTSATVSASPGQPGVTGAYPEAVNSSTQGAHESACNHRPWTKTTGTPAGSIAPPAIEISEQASAQRGHAVRRGVERRRVELAAGERVRQRGGGALGLGDVANRAEDDVHPGGRGADRPLPRAAERVERAGLQ